MAAPNLLGGSLDEWAAVIRATLECAARDHAAGRYRRYRSGRWLVDNLAGETRIMNQRLLTTVYNHYRTELQCRKEGK